MDNPKKNICKEQLAYANILDIGMKIGFVLLLASFFVYMFGIVEPHIAHTDLPKYWTLPVDQYLVAADISTGWHWLDLAGKGDFMNFIGIAFLSMVTIFCYLRILPILFKNKDTVYGVIAILEVLVLVLAASGLFAGGH